jgi:hypothetical protein
MMDEDVFLDETILEEDEAALLLLDRDEALASRLSRWKRPALPADLASGCSRSVGTPTFHSTRSPSISSWGTSLLRGRRNLGRIQRRAFQQLSVDWIEFW